MAVMELFGMLVPEEAQAGFRLVLDEKCYVKLLRRGKVIATFDPRDYTAAELRAEVSEQLHSGGPPRSDPAHHRAAAPDPCDE